MPFGFMLRGAMPFWIILTVVPPPQKEWGTASAVPHTLMSTV